MCWQDQLFHSGKMESSIWVFNVVQYPLNFANMDWAAHLDMATISPADGPPSLYDSDVIFLSYLFL